MKGEITGVAVEICENYRKYDWGRWLKNGYKNFSEMKMKKMEEFSGEFRWSNKSGRKSFA